MKVRTRFSTEPLLVLSIHVPRRDSPYPAGDRTTFMVLEGPGLTAVGEADCEAVDRSLNDFVYVDHRTFDERVATFMWRPLAESDRWDEIVEFHPEGLAALRRMIADAGLPWPA